jgi:hypothetical protein
MKAIKWFIAMLLFVHLACKQGEPIIDQSFVRFHVMLDNNGKIIKNTLPVGNRLETATYIHTTFEPIKIPVLLSSNDYNEEVLVDYTVTTSGGFSNFTISPKQLKFGKNVSDTITINFNDKWKGSGNEKIVLNLVKVSKPSVMIGWQRAENKLDRFEIGLGEIDKVNFSFQKSQYDIEGNTNEEILIPIQFSRAISQEELKNNTFIIPNFDSLSLCDGKGFSFDYQLIPVDIVGSNSLLVYKLKVLSPINGNFKLSLKLNDKLSGFTVGSISLSTITRFTKQNTTADVATNFYNLDDPFYRTYGKAWYKDPTMGLCRWSTFNTFTKPVAVEKNSKFDNGKGYHKYKIGFVGNNLPVGTNPFDFRRFYEGASVESPAYTMIEAIEFLPNANMNSGKVRVIPQSLKFVKTGGSALFVDICGDGTYTYNSVLKRWEIYIEVHSDESKINGKSDVIHPMYIYSNNNDATNPADLSLPCPLRNEF